MSAAAAGVAEFAASVERGARILDGARVAVVHEWVDQTAGSEKVFAQLAALFPHADLYCLTARPGVELGIDRPVARTVLDTPRLRDRRALTLPLMPAAWAQLGRRAGAYDVVISSSHAFARWFGPARAATHLSYVYTPMRYAWYPELDERGASVPAPIRALFQRADRASVRWTDSFCGISRVVADRIADTYGCEARVIHPPVETDRFAGIDPDVPCPELAGEPGYLFAVSRWIPYKRLDLAVDAAVETGRRIVVAGSGPAAADLHARAASHPELVTVIERPDDATLDALYANAAATVFAAEEDFGIVPVESQATGTPVIAYGAGGSLDTVVPGVTGVHAAAQTVDSFAGAIEELFARLDDGSVSAAACRAHAATFSQAHFAARVVDWVADTVEA